MKDVVIFDVDNTILEGQSQGLFVKFLFKENLLSFFAYLLLVIWVICYRFRIVSNPLPAMKYGLSFIKNKTISEVDEITEKFFNEVLKRKIYPEAINLIKEHQKAGRLLVLVSNAPDILVKKIACNFDVENFISTKLEYKDDVYTGNIIGEIMYGKQKLDSVHDFVQTQGLSLNNSWGYGDHESDIFLLSKISHPYAVNPSRNLRKIALKNNWPILTFKL